MPAPGMRSSLGPLASHPTFYATRARPRGAPAHGALPLEASTPSLRRSGSFGLRAPRSENGLPTRTPLQRHRSEYRQASVNRPQRNRSVLVQFARTGHMEVKIL